MASISFHTARTGVMEQQKGLDVIANNISNVHTNGFKAGVNSFQDLLYTNVDSTAEDDVTVGHGAKLAKADTIFTKGVLEKTERDLDFAIDDDNGFFQINLASGNTIYTRNGNFELREYGNGFLLVSGAYNGYVTDNNGDPIVLTGLTDEKIKSLESIVGTFVAENMDGLARNADGSFSPSVSSGAMSSNPNLNLKQGYVEASNVDYANEVTEVIKVQRAFQMNSRMVSISDEIADTINNLR